MDMSSVRNLFIELYRLEEAFGKSPTIARAVNASMHLCQVFGLPVRLDGSSQLDGVPLNQRVEFINKRIIELGRDGAWFPDDIKAMTESLLHTIRVSVMDYVVEHSRTSAL